MIDKSINPLIGRSPIIVVSTFSFFLRGGAEFNTRLIVAVNYDNVLEY